ncbi:hypothetical protein METBIDRAFT_24535, partial [Metschnikowia bicuspidata var. bicuspidata NRRL YB-4993]
VFAVTITENTVQISTIDITLGDLTINAGVYYSIVNSALVTLAGSVTNAGGFYVTSANGLAASVVMTGSSFVNSGTCAFNSLSATVLSTYDIATLGSFLNTGDMYFGISGATIVGTPFIVTSVTSWSNDGMMVFRRASGDSALLVIEQVVGSGGLSTILNDGSICLYNTYWLQTTSIVGSGCITVGSGSEMQLQLSVGTLLFSVAESQTIYLASSDSVLSILGLSLSLLPDNTITVAGFGNGNKIELDILFLSYTYSSTTGILRLTLAILLSVEIYIGPGYNSLYFSTASTLLSKSISYSRSPPNAAPAICACSYNFPEVTTTALSSSTSTTSVNSDGSVETASGVVIVNTDSAGVVTTTTSII